MYICSTKHLLLRTQCTLLYIFQSGLLWIPISTWGMLGMLLDLNFGFLPFKRNSDLSQTLHQIQGGCCVYTIQLIVYSLWPLYGSCRLVCLFCHYVFNADMTIYSSNCSICVRNLANTDIPGFVARLRPTNSSAFGHKANFKCDHCLGINFLSYSKSNALKNAFRNTLL